MRAGVVSSSTVAGMTGLALDDIEDLVASTRTSGEHEDHGSGMRDQEMREYESSGVLTH